MTELPGESGGAGARAAISVALLATLSWQVYLVVASRRNAPALKKLVEGFGGDLPAITEAFLRFHELLVLVPAGTALAGLLVLRRRPLPWYTALLVAIALGVTMALDVWTSEAFLAPLIHLMEAIG